MTKPKGSLNWQTIDYMAKMKCLGVLGEDDAGQTIIVSSCSWPYEMDRARDARQRAKDHAKYHPGHTVEVVNERVSTYIWVVPKEADQEEQG